ncbi:MAG TPA: DUF6328 family protein [Steroidobacteraceae bacterium]|nr:DUF6328 family protein [Steroidobacteraceae bacterium]
MSLPELTKTALGELRMQMLGVQVLLGFQFQSLFQQRFVELTRGGRIVDAAGLLLLLIALVVLISIPCRHRIVEKGEATPQLLKVTRQAANLALAPLAGGLACDVWVSIRIDFGPTQSTLMAVVAGLVATLAWFALPRLLRSTPTAQDPPMHPQATPLHAKIEQMLTEARVVLPGSQALLGFQMVVMLTPAFRELPPAARDVHAAALLCNALAIVLLICPAAVHRIAFRGEDNPRFHGIGSQLIGAALAPLAVSLACETYVGLLKLFGDARNAALAGCLVLLCMLAVWYLLPLGIRKRVQNLPFAPDRAQR